MLYLYKNQSVDLQRKSVDWCLYESIHDLIWVNVLNVLISLHTWCPEGHMYLKKPAAFNWRFKYLWPFSEHQAFKDEKLSK